jgi:hypothetical protein
MPRLRRSRPPTHFPEVSGATLDGDPMTVPSDLQAEWNLLIVSFRDDLDPLADLWISLARRIAAGTDGRLAAYELPVVGRSPKMLRPIISDTLRARAEDADERARTVPIHEDRKSFRRMLGLRNDDDVNVYLVARDGRIRWRGRGVLTPDLVAGLERAVGETLTTRGAAEGPPTHEPDRPVGEGLPVDSAAPPPLQ